MKATHVGVAKRGRFEGVSGPLVAAMKATHVGVAKSSYLDELMRLYAAAMKATHVGVAKLHCIRSRHVPHGRAAMKATHVGVAKVGQMDRRVEPFEIAAMKATHVGVAKRRAPGPATSPGRRNEGHARRRGEVAWPWAIAGRRPSAPQ